MKAELYILGVLHRGNFHPYEIKRRLSQAMIECFTDVDVGTLYYAVRQLAECGLLTAVARQRVARGGPPGLVWLCCLPYTLEEKHVQRVWRQNHDEEGGNSAESQ